MPSSMHDWTLVSIGFDWKTAHAELLFNPYGGGETVTALGADGVTALEIPRRQSWGPSVSVNAVEGPRPSAQGMQELKIEMQSGDMITIVAREFHLPAQ